MKPNSSAAGADLRRDVDTIKDDIALLRSDLVAVIKDLVEVGKVEAGDAKARLQDAVHERLEKLGDAAQGVAERGRRALNSAESYIEEKPFQSLAIAFGVGVLLGAVLRK